MVGNNNINPQKNKFKISDDNGDTIMVRGCALDSGTLTTDTEIVRMSHCGGFYYDNRFVTTNFKSLEITKICVYRYARGCVQSCNDADACNSAVVKTAPFVLIIFLNLIKNLDYILV